MKAFLFGLSLIFSSMAFAGNPSVTIATNMGNIIVELNPDAAPVTVKNFLDYVNAQFFDQTLFHRVVKGFVIQGGGLTLDMQEKPGNPPIKNEAGNGLGNLRGTIAMARTDEVDSATSQFFINTVDNTRLDHVDNTPEHFGYAVFGKVTQGMDIIDAIQNVPVQDVGDYDHVPLTQVVTQSIRLN